MLAYPAWITAAGPWWSAYEIDADEGFNLIKGALLAGGHPLYREIWSDQPPLLTVLLAGLHRVAPWNVAAGRGLVLAFAVLLLGSLFAVVRRSEGRLAAWAAVLALGGSGLFQRYSAAVMIGLPAIAVAMAALAVADGESPAPPGGGRRWPSQAARALLVGALFGAALQIKLFVLVLLPFLLWVVARRRTDARSADGSSSGRPALRAVLGVVGAALVTFAAVALGSGEPLIDQLVGPHLAPYFAERAEAAPGVAFGWLAQTPALSLLAVGGAIVALRQRRRERALPLAMTLATLLVVGVHRPLFPHHLLLLLVPMGWLAGIAAGALADAAGARFDRPEARRLAGALLCLGLVGAAIPGALRFHRLTARGGAAWRGLPELLAANAVGTSRVVADCPIDAFRAGLLVPPELAVFSGKRIGNGELTPEAIVAAIRRWQPNQIVLRRFRLHPRVDQYLLRSGFERRPAPPGVVYFVQ